MEATRKADSFVDQIEPPRPEDAGLEDCALPPESIEEAFLKAASAVRSRVYASDDEDDSGGGVVDDPREDYSDAPPRITAVVTAPSEGRAEGKSSGSTDVLANEVSVGGGDAKDKSDAVVCPGAPGSARSCLKGLQGLEIVENSRGILGKKVRGLE